MEPKQALELLAQCAAQFKGTLQDHQALQGALQVLGALVEPKEEEKPKRSSKPAPKAVSVPAVDENEEGLKE